MLDGDNLTVEEYIELFTNMKELHPITEQEFEAEMLVMEQKKQLDGEKLSGEVIEPRCARIVVFS